MSKKVKYSKSTIKKAMLLTIGSALNYAPESLFIAPSLTDAELEYAHKIRRNVIDKILGDYRGEYAGNLADALSIIHTTESSKTTPT